MVGKVRKAAKPLNQSRHDLGSRILRFAPLEIGNEHEQSDRQRLSGDFLRRQRNSERFVHASQSTNAPLAPRRQAIRAGKL